MRLGTGLSLLVGGARSGKSDLAVKLGEAWNGAVVLVATATAGDDDMAARIARHQEDRPDSWTVLEQPMFGAEDVTNAPADALMILDCVTMLVSNLFFSDVASVDAQRHVDELGAALAKRSGPTIVITNEVGLGIHPPNEMSRAYRGLLGRCNRDLAAHAETSLFIVAGRALPLAEVELTW